MIRGKYHPTPWARVATVAAAAGLALLTGAGTGNASPTSNATPKDSNPRTEAIGDKATASTAGGSFIHAQLNGATDDFHTGLITLTFDDDSRLLTYCIDLKHPLSRQQPYIESEWTATGIPADKQAKILWILGHSQPNVADAAVLDAAGVAGGASLPKVGEVVYAGTQAAIWHFSDGMTLLPRDANATDFTQAQYDAIQKVYGFLTSAANTGQNGPPTLTITPPKATGLVGDLLGPFTVTTSAPTITLAATGGAQLLGADKTTPVTSLGSGGQFWVKLGQAGSATVTGTGQGFVAAGRAFVVGGAPADTSVRPLTGSDTAQKLIAAELTPQQVTARVAVQATVAPTPTPTPTVAPTSPPLAATGASPMPKVGVAVLLLVIGTGLTLAARRRRDGHHA